LQSLGPGGELLAAGQRGDPAKACPHGIFWKQKLRNKKISRKKIWKQKGNGPIAGVAKAAAATAAAPINALFHLVLL